MMNTIQEQTVQALITKSLDPQTPIYLDNSLQFSPWIIKKQTKSQNKSINNSWLISRKRISPPKITKNYQNTVKTKELFNNTPDNKFNVPRYQLSANTSFLKNQKRQRKNVFTSKQYKKVKQSQQQVGLESTIKSDQQNKSKNFDFLSVKEKKINYKIFSPLKRIQPLEKIKNNEIVSFDSKISKTSEKQKSDFLNKTILTMNVIDLGGNSTANPQLYKQKKDHNRSLSYRISKNAYRNCHLIKETSYKQMLFQPKAIKLFSRSNKTQVLKFKNFKEPQVNINNINTFLY